jgi:hypothetical protein
MNIVIYLLNTLLVHQIYKMKSSGLYTQRRRISWKPDWRTSKWRFESMHYWGTCLVFWVSQQQYASGGGNTGEVQSLAFQDVNPRSGLNWLCLAMTLLKALFLEWGLFSGWKPKIFDRATTALVHCSLLRGVAFGEPEVHVLSWWSMYCCCKGWSTVAGLFFS